MKRYWHQDYLKAFGEHLKEIRLSKNLTQEELCHRCGLQPSHLGRIERGERTLTAPMIYIIADGLGVDQDKLLRFKFKPKKEH